ncbi:hypothetical protein [Streptomyces sp. NPDC005012]|uniref:hypothetical protein n=1 Tax=Streptomyces sp. NPDC005012 TaxID=3154558 RepID=UPI0033A0142B
MSDRPLLLLDVDGPLNPFGARFVRHRGYVTHRMLPDCRSPLPHASRRRAAREARVRLHPGHGARLLALPYQLTWATAWCRQANELVAPAIGLPGDLPVVEWPSARCGRSADGVHWKTRTLLEWAAGRPFAWVDDELTGRDADHVATHHPGSALLLRIDPRKGLRDRDFGRLEHWARTLG